MRLRGVIPDPNFVTLCDNESDLQRYDDVDEVSPGLSVTPPGLCLMTGVGDQKDKSVHP